MELHQRRLKAESYFRGRWKKASREDSQDFGSYCVEQWLTGRHLDTSYLFLGIDFFRESGVKARKVVDPKNRRGDIYNSGMKEEGVILETQKAEESMEIERFQSKSMLRDERLSERGRAVLILHYEWGLTLKEIGDVLGVSQSRTYQLLKETQLEQKKRIMRDENV